MLTGLARIKPQAHNEQEAGLTDMVRGGDSKVGSSVADALLHEGLP